MCGTNKKQEKVFCIMYLSPRYYGSIF